MEQETITATASIYPPTDTSQPPLLCAVSVRPRSPWATVRRLDVDSLRVGRATEAGIVFVNGFSHNIFGLPFGGTKDNGYGRKTAAETLREFGYAHTLSLGTSIGALPRCLAVADVLRDSAATSVTNLPLISCSQL